MSAADPSARRLDVPEFLFVSAFLPLATFSWVAIVLAELGVYTHWRVFVGGAALTAIAAALVVHEWRQTRLTLARVSGRTGLGLALLILLSAGLLSHPGEYLIEGADGSIYLAIGRNIERTGEIISVDPVVGLVPPELRQSFFRGSRQKPNDLNRLPGGLRLDARDQVSPAFFHLLPVWLAMAAGAAGPNGPYYLNAFLGVMGVLLVWLIGRRVWSSTAGFVAASLLTLNFGQVFYSGLSSSEMLAQFLVLSAIFFAVLAWDTGTRLSGACAGVAVGLAAFARIDAMLLLVPLAIAWLVLTRSRQAEGAWRWFAGLLAVSACHAMLHAATVSRVYTQGIFGDGGAALARLAAPFGTLTIVVGCCVAAAFVVFVLRTPGRWLTSVVVAVLCMAALSPSVVATISLLLTPLGLALAATGIAVALAGGVDRRTLPVLVPLLASTMLVLAWRESTTLPHDFRRAVPVILPFAMLFIGFLVAEGRRLPAWLRPVVWTVPVALAAVFVADAAPIVRHPLAQRMHAQFDEIARQIPEDGLVITDSSLPGHVAAALQYTFNRPALRLAPPSGGEAGVGLLIDRAMAAGKQVFVAVSPFAEARRSGLRRLDLAAYSVNEVGDFSVSYEVLSPVRGTFPRQHRLDHLSIALYKVTPLDTETRIPLPFTLDVGGDDFPFIIQGFHEREMNQSASVRWTTGEPRLQLPRLAGSTTDRMTLVVRFSAGRPLGHAPPLVAIAIDGLPAGIIADAIDDQFEFRLPLTEEIITRLVAGPTILSITTDFFVPKNEGINDDDRQLGIVLDWVRIE